MTGRYVYERVNDRYPRDQRDRDHYRITDLREGRGSVMATAHDPVEAAKIVEALNQAWLGSLEPDPDYYDEDVFGDEAAELERQRDYDDIGWDLRRVFSDHAWDWVRDLDHPAWDWVKRRIGQ